MIESSSCDAQLARWFGIAASQFLGSRRVRVESSRRPSQSAVVVPRASGTRSRGRRSGIICGTGRAPGQSARAGVDSITRYGGQLERQSACHRCIDCRRRDRSHIVANPASLHAERGGKQRRMEDGHLVGPDRHLRGDLPTDRSDRALRRSDRHPDRTRCTVGRERWELRGAGPRATVRPTAAWATRSSEPR
jgi:hypothetical protein